MKRVFGIFIFVVSSCTLKAQYTIPGATQQPAWIFPLWIENGDGQRDTLYLGYDSTASWQGWLGQDSIFGAMSTTIDSSKFNATFLFAMYGDSALKVVVCSLGPNNFFPESSVGQISFIHAVYPLTFSWDVTLLHSNNLPFIDQPPIPPAQGQLYFEMGTFGGAYTNDSLLCTTSNTLLISDTTQPTFNYCYTKDSVRFQDIFNTTGAQPGYVIMEIHAWDGELLKVKNINPLSDLVIYPNPYSSDFNVRLPLQKNGDEVFLKVYNSIGELIAGNYFTLNIENTIRLRGPEESGIYFIEVKNSRGFICRKILIKQ
jgi:hypothetical protein